MDDDWSVFDSDDADLGAVFSASIDQNPFILSGGYEQQTDTVIYPAWTPADQEDADLGRDMVTAQNTAKTSVANTGFFDKAIGVFGKLLGTQGAGYFNGGINPVAPQNPLANFLPQRQKVAGASGNNAAYKSASDSVMQYAPIAIVFALIIGLLVVMGRK